MWEGEKDRRIREAEMIEINKGTDKMSYDICSHIDYNIIQEIERKVDR